MGRDVPQLREDVFRAKRRQEEVAIFQHRMLLTEIFRWFLVTDRLVPKVLRDDGDSRGAQGGVASCRCSSAGGSEKARQASEEQTAPPILPAPKARSSA